ncbi:MAG: hypothetical protein ACE14V_04865 [bacterium]
MNLGFGPGRKSPTIARVLSLIIPGLGHFYAGEYLAGIIWLVIAFPLMFMLGIPQMFFYGLIAFRPIPLFFVGYIIYVVWCSHDASKTVAEQNGRLAAQEQIAAKKKDKEEFERLKEEARKNIYQ